MPRSRDIVITPPGRGKISANPFAYQPAESLYDSRDFWPIDAKVDRNRMAIRPGFAAYATLEDVNLIYPLNVAASESSQTTFKRQLMVAANGTLYKNTGTGSTFNSVASGLPTGVNLQAANFHTKLYIANSTEHKVYDYIDNSLVPFVGMGGHAPQRCTLIANWSARLVMSGDAQHPHTVFFSRVDEPSDWEYGEEDIGSALAVSSINEPITALIPHTRECLLCGTYNSLWIFRGDPSTGTLEELSAVVGPINATAWCKDPHGAIYMLTRKGLYRMAGPCGAAPEALSEHTIPQSLLALDGVNDKAYLEYDTRFRCVHIYISGSNAQAFHYFPETGGFWPVTAPPTITILAIGRYDLLDTGDVSGVLVGGSGGTMYRLDRTAAIGGATKAFAQFLFPLAQLGRMAMIRDADFLFGQNTNDNSATVDIYGAESAEDVVAKPASRKYSITYVELSDNHNHCYPRTGGQSGFIDINQVDTSKHISFEQARLGVHELGRERG